MEVKIRVKHTDVKLKLKNVSKPFSVFPFYLEIL